MIDDDTALVLSLGRRNSTTCLALVLDRYARDEATGFGYGRRHTVESDVCPRGLQALRAGFPARAGRLGGDHLIDLAVLGQASETMLPCDTEIAIQANRRPNTFVLGRNLVLMTFAAIAYRSGPKHLVFGERETGYSAIRTTTSTQSTRCYSPSITAWRRNP